MEIVGLRKNGEEFPATASVSKIQAPSGTIYTTVVRDISQETAAREELLQAKHMAEAANETKLSFIANISHELRTPLNAIIGFSYLLKTKSKNQKRREYAQDIHDSGNHLLEIINNILEISRIEIGKVKLYEERVNVDNVIDACIRILDSAKEEKHIEICKDVSDDLPDLWADRRLLTQTVLNLLSNAFKFTKQGGRVDVIAHRSLDGGVDLLVTDTGVGMSREDAKRVGEPFMQADNRLARKYEGTGLGLAIAKRLVQLHGGELVIESALGQGTLVSICLPSSRSLLPQLTQTAG